MIYSRNIFEAFDFNLYGEECNIRDGKKNEADKRPGAKRLTRRACTRTCCRKHAVFPAVADRVNPN